MYRGLAEVQNLRDVQTAANLDLSYCLNLVSFRQPRCSVPISHSVMIFFIPFAQKLTLCCHLLLYTLLTLASLPSRNWFAPVGSSSSFPPSAPP